MVKAANSHEDIEAGRGRRRRRSASISSEDSLCFSDAEEESWHSPYGSRGDCDASDTEISGAPERDRGGRSSSALDCSSDAEDLEIGQLEIKVHSLKAEKDCRICHLSLEGGNPESGIPIELGCSCKGDLAAAHKQCAETWFKIRGNKTCEICGTTVCNVVGVTEPETVVGQWTETSNAIPAASTEIRSFWQGHRFLNFLLACMVIAFVISWLFHFNVPP